MPVLVGVVGRAHHRQGLAKAGADVTEGATVATGVPADPVRALLTQEAPAHEDVACALALMDRSCYPDRRVDHTCLDRAEELAAAQGWPDLQMRAELLRAWESLTSGDVVRAAQLGRRINAWAKAQRDQDLLARSHDLLAALFRGIGDNAEALTQSVHAVANTPPDAEPRLRATQVMSLAVGLIITKSVGPALRRFEEALALAESTGDPALQLMVLNNVAYGMYDIGNLDAARAYADRMRDLRRRHGTQLKSTHLETLARIEITSGRYDEAERLLAPLVSQPSAPIHSDADSYAFCLLTLAESQRLRGAVNDAQTTLDLCAQVADERRLDHVTALRMREQARLYADLGRYREAYEELTRYLDAWTRSQDAQREVRACVTHAMYEVEQARRDADQFRELATRDPLTGLHNRRALADRLPTAIAAVETTGVPLSVALFDLDLFKRINDTCSHETGDLVLKQVATLALASVPPSASVVRMGGEEFLVILPECDIADAAAHAERIRLAIQDYDWPPITDGLPVTVSVGVTTCTGATTIPALLSLADQHLYAAKESGRNRVVDDVTAPPPPEDPGSAVRKIPRPRRRYRSDRGHGGPAG
jgi:two-component system cell cycle response regulator